MQLKQRIKRLAAFLLAMSMALGCMPGSAWAETATPTDLIATDGEASPRTRRFLPLRLNPKEKAGFPARSTRKYPMPPGTTTTLLRMPPLPVRKNPQKRRRAMYLPILRRTMPNRKRFPTSHPSRMRMEAG